MKKYLIFAASALALASCSSDDFLGENPGTAQNATTAINFGGEAGKITRATSNEGTPQKMLDGQFLVYGVKKRTDNPNFSPVFTNYSVWDDTQITTSNSKGWEYVGTKGATNLGSGSIELPNTHDQTIKYWDYSSPEYRFVAGSPIKNFEYDVNQLTYEINGAKVKELAGHIEKNPTGEAGTPLVAYPVYIADPVKAEKVNNDYKKTVTFKFKRQQSMVRVGFYETIPGYSITDIKFYEADGTAPAGNNIILYSSTNDYFVGGTNVSGTVTYDWTTPDPSYKFTYDDTGLTKSKNWYAGELTNGVEATTSSVTDIETLYGTDQDMAPATGYFAVLPTPETTTASAILIKCDYTLTADDHCGEEIKVTGATAAIPAAFSKWEANTRYTYLFKISDNTNGTTGTTGDTPGLFPITFNAVVKEVEQGTTTTVATPSITTYQDGSVEGTKIEYKTGKPIYATVADETIGTLKDLKNNSTEVGNVQVYKLSKERTEAELQVEAIVTEEIKPANQITTYVPTEDTTVNNVSLDAKKHLYFEPTAEAEWYAIQYKYAPDTYKYKVIEVK